VSFNGSGSYSPPGANYPAVAGTSITAANRNAIDADIATALSTCVLKDGQQTITANIPMSGNKITGIGAATARTDAASLANIQDGTGVYVATVAGTADVITLTPSPVITAYAAGQTFRFIASGANTTNVTVNINALGAKAITKLGSTALAAGDIPSGSMVSITYDGTRFILGSVADLAKSGGTLTGQLLFSTTSPFAGDLINGICEGRLTLTTATPVTTSDVTAAETLYFTPYKGNRIAIYDGTNWDLHAFTELSIDVPDATNVYDVFVYDNAGTLTLELTAWTNTTTRATALALQNGVLCKTGALTRRYVGSFYCTTAGNGQTEDSVTKRYVWNHYNRVTRSLRAVDTTDSWTYSTNTLRRANDSAANQVEAVIGVAEDAVSVHVASSMTNSSGTSRAGCVGVGVNSTSVNSAINAYSYANSSTRVPVMAHYVGIPAVGLTSFWWLEAGDGTDTQTWYGDNGVTLIQSGITGEVRA
jgi:hypothetical protein